jgi:hypothetical protein
MMQWIISAVIALVVVVGGGLYFMSSGSLSMEEGKVNVLAPELNEDVTSSEDSKVLDKATPKLAEKASAFTGSFFDLATRGGKYRCEVTSTGASAGTLGTVYVSGTDLRGDFTTVSAGKTIESHMLKKGDTVYVWGAGMPQGVMMQASVMQGQGSTATQGQGVSGTQEYGWNCVATGGDTSLFVKPSNIEFMDVGAMMQGMGSVPGAR